MIEQWETFLFVSFSCQNLFKEERKSFSRSQTKIIELSISKLQVEVNACIELGLWPKRDRSRADRTFYKMGRLFLCKKCNLKTNCWFYSDLWFKVLSQRNSRLKEINRKRQTRERKRFDYRFSIQFERRVQFSDDQKTKNENEALFVCVFFFCSSTLDEKHSSLLFASVENRSADRFQVFDEEVPRQFRSSIFTRNHSGDLKFKREKARLARKTFTHKQLTTFESTKMHPFSLSSDRLFSISFSLTPRQASSMRTVR